MKLSSATGSLTMNPGSTMVSGLTMNPTTGGLTMNPATGGLTMGSTSQSNIGRNTAQYYSKRYLTVAYLHLGRKADYPVSSWTQQYLNYYIDVLFITLY